MRTNKTANIIIPMIVDPDDDPSVDPSVELLDPNKLNDDPESVELLDDPESPKEKKIVTYTTRTITIIIIMLGLDNIPFT
jgi:hypothetical protein